MTTLTQMDRTATGWKCPRCGDTQEDHLLSMQWVACNCAAVDASRGPPNLDLPLDTVVTMVSGHATASGHAVASGSENASGHVFASGPLAAEVGMPDAFRHGPIVTLTPGELRRRYPRKL